MAALAFVLAGGWLGVAAGLWEGGLAFACRHVPAASQAPRATSLLPHAVLLDGLLGMLAASILVTLFGFFSSIKREREPEAGGGGPRSSIRRWEPSAAAVLFAGVVGFSGLALLSRLADLHYTPPLLSPSGIALATLVAAVCLGGGIAAWRMGERVLAFLQRVPAWNALAAMVPLAASGIWLSASLAGGIPEARPSGLPPPQGAPNILLVVLDAVRVDHCSAYGYGRPTTPNIEALSREGTLFLKAVTPGIWTVPSHASLFTGLHPSAHGADRTHPYLSSRLETLAERLGSAGYQTASFSGNPWISAESGLGQGFEELRVPWQLKSSDRSRSDQPFAVRLAVRLLRAAESDPLMRSRAEYIGREALEWLDDARDPTRPFLVFVNFFDAHAPRDPPPDLMRRFLPPGADPSESRRIGRIRTSDLEFGEVRLTAQEQGLLSCLYDAEVARADRGLGALVSGLASRGLLDGTVLAVTADHGENFGEKGMWGHHLIINESLLHVPLLVRYPARFPPGRREPALVQIHDLFPTLLELAGVPRRAGENRQPTLFPESLASSGREFAFAEEPVPTMVLDRLSARFPGRSLDAYNRALWSATDGRFKAVLSSRGERWLYDLDTDPREERDLSASMPEVMSRLTAALEEHIRIETARRPAPEQNETMPSELIEQLRVLGYVK